jgi:chromosome segregation ATPase
VRIEHPDLPEELKSAAGELVAALWARAQGAAHDDLAAFRSEAQTAVLEAKTAQASAEDERTAALLERDQARQATQLATERALQLEHDLAAERADQAVQWETARRQQAALEGELAEARRDFAAELEKHRQALERSEERREAAERRALLEIDRERSAAAKLQKELAQARQNLQEAEGRHHAALTRLQAELGDARREMGVAEGMLQEMRMQCQQQGEELQSLRTIVVEGETRNHLLERDLAAGEEKITELEKELQQWRTMLAVENALPQPR